MSRTLADHPFIVVGAPRSGTTYLRPLSPRSRVIITDEARVFTWLHRALMEAVEERRAVARKKMAFVRHLRATLPQLLRDFYTELDPRAGF